MFAKIGLISPPAACLYLLQCISFFHYPCVQESANPVSVSSCLLSFPWKPHIQSWFIVSKNLLMSMSTTLFIGLSLLFVQLLQGIMTTLLRAITIRYFQKIYLVNCFQYLFNPICTILSSTAGIPAAFSHSYFWDVCPFSSFGCTARSLTAQSNPGDSPQDSFIFPTVTSSIQSPYSFSSRNMLGGILRH